MPSSVYGFYFSDHKFASHTVPKYGHLSYETQDIYTDNMKLPHVMYKQYMRQKINKFFYHRLEMRLPKPFLKINNQIHFYQNVL